MRSRRKFSLCLIGVTLLGLSVASPASAQSSDTVTVTGQTVSTVSITLDTESVTFGQITQAGLATTTSPVTGTATATFGGSSLSVTRTVTPPQTGFPPLLVNNGGGLTAVQNSTVANPNAISDLFYVQISGSEPGGVFSYTVTYTASTL